MGEHREVVLRALRRAANAVADGAASFVSDGKDLMIGTVRNPSDPKAGATQLRVEREHKARVAQLRAENPTLRKGVGALDGPGVHFLDGAGPFGTDIILVKHSQKFNDIVPAAGTIDGAEVEYFDVAKSPIAVLNTADGIATWINDNADRYLINSTYWAQVGHVEHLYSDDVQAPPVSIGIVCARSVAFSIPETEYEIINPALAAVRLLVGRVAGLAATGVRAVAPPPSEAAAVGREIGADLETLVDVCNRVTMFVRGQSAGGDLDEVNLVEFHETAPAPAPSHGQVSGTEDVVCDVIVTRGSDGQTAKGVRIGDIGGIILATLG